MINPPKSNAEIGLWRRIISALVNGQTAFPIARFGDLKNGNYTEIQRDGSIVFYGNATVFEDLQGSALELQVLGVGVSMNSAENSVDFTTSATLTDFAYDNYQLRHAWKSGTNVHFHLHWKQKENATPNFLLRYRWQAMGEASTTAWTDIPMTTNVFTYTTGTINQKSFGAEITPPANADLSDVIEIQIFRDTANASGAFAGADPYTQTVGISFIDAHYEIDTIGSRQEFIK